MLILAEATKFLDLLPNFQGDCRHLHDILVIFPFLFSVIGLMWAALRMARSHSFNEIGILVTLMVVVILVQNLGVWGDVLNDAIAGIPQEMGWAGGGANPGNAWQIYARAIQRKWGTDSIGEGNKQLYDRAKNRQPLDNQGAPGINNNVHFTTYGYEKRGDPDWDKKSANGIGNHGNKLVAGTSLAISDDLVNQYGLGLGETVSITTSDGRTISGTYDDTTGYVPGTKTPLTGIVDLYDPNQQYANLSGVGISGLNGMGVQDTGGNKPAWWDVKGWLGKASEATQFAFWGVFVYGLSVCAAALMWLASLVQQVLLLLCYAISPIFIGMLAIPWLRGTASAFLMMFVSLCIWQLAWVLSDALVVALCDLAVNPQGSVGLSIANSGGGFGVWIALAFLVIFASILMPWAITKQFLAGHGALSGLLGASQAQLSNVQRQANSTYRSMVLGAGAMRSAGGSSGGGAGAKSSSPMGLPSSSNGSGGVNYAVRPGFQTQPAAKP